MGVKRLFVRAATFTHGDPVQTSIPQSWSSSGAPFSVVLVFNFDGGLLRHFKDLEIPATARAMAAGISGQARLAEARGVHIEGIQFDIDAPTRLLPKYADLVGAVKSDLGQARWLYSATALSSWLGTVGIRDLAKQVAYLAPQFYESDVALTVGHNRTISDLDALERGLGRAAGLPVPFYAGLAAYGRGLLYDDRGRLSGVYRGLAPEDALRHPALRFDETRPLDKAGKSATRATYVGEDLTALTAIAPGRDGKGLGFHLRYDLPTPTLVASQMSVFRESEPSNCLGIIFYRLPAQDDSLALPLVSVRDALAGKSPYLAMNLKLASAPDPWRPVEAGPGNRDQIVRVAITAVGDSATAAEPGAVRVLLGWSGQGVEEADPGDFDEARPVRVEGDEMSSCSPAEANGLVLTRSRVLPGQTLKAGMVRLTGSPRVWAKWTAVGPGGFQTFSGSS